jgi:hypothetical protein
MASIMVPMVTSGPRTLYTSATTPAEATTKEIPLRRMMRVCFMMISFSLRSFRADPREKLETASLTLAITGPR